MCNYEISNSTLENCTFENNYGGGVYNDSSSPTLTNCTFTGNAGRGGMENVFYSSPTLFGAQEFPGPCLRFVFMKTPRLLTINSKLC